MKILHLTLKKKWFDMIASGIKTQEYREIKPYWTKRLYKKFDAILFKNGYSKNSPSVLVEFEQMFVGYGFKAHGAPQEKVYVLRLGKILGTGQPEQKEAT